MDAVSRFSSPVQCKYVDFWSRRRALFSYPATDNVER